MPRTVDQPVFSAGRFNNRWIDSVEFEITTPVVWSAACIILHAVRLADAIWRDDVEAVRDLVTRNPALIHEDVLIRTDSNWGPPMTYAANVGRDVIIRLLHSLGAKDLESAAGRAALEVLLLPRGTAIRSPTGRKRKWR